MLTTFLLLFSLNINGGTMAGDDKKAPSFNKDVYPILTEFCQRCHKTGGSKKAQGILFDSPEKALEAIQTMKPKDESFTTFMKAGKSAESVLYLKLVDPPYGKKMPLGEEKPTKEQIEIIKQWIDSGAGK
jgi:hypothetical protein